jgi:iron complex transport system substrate-binding protein
VNAIGWARSAALLLPPLLILLILAAAGCGGQEAPGGESLAPFGVSDEGPYKIALDQFRRRIALVPRGAALPEALAGFPPHRILRTPASRVIAASGTYDASIIFALGRGESIVGTSYRLSEWSLPEMRGRLSSGKVRFIGDYNALDYEAIKILAPDLILISSSLSLGKLEELGLPALGTYDHDNNGLDNRVSLISFLGAFFAADAEAEAIAARIRAGIGEVRQKAARAPRPTLSWAIYYNKQVFVLPGGFWLAELMEACGGDYLFRGYGNADSEMSLEEFIHRSKDADVFFANVLYEEGVKSKADYVRLHPDLAGFRAFQPGGSVLVPQGLLFEDSAGLDKIAAELFAAIHPEAPQPESFTYFQRLPD